MIPVRPAPATPNNEPITAIPATEPRAAPPAVPIIAPTPVAISGAASPPVTPVRQERWKNNRDLLQYIGS